MDLFSELVDAIHDSLTRHPRDWTVSAFKAVHGRTGIIVWLANGHYGLHIEGPCGYYGGVTFASTFFGWATPWRRKLYRAAVALRNNKVRADLGGSRELLF